MDVDLKLAGLHAKGMHITPEIESKIKSDVQQKKLEYNNKVDQVGIPDIFKSLFLTTKKAQAEQYARQIVITEYDLFLLIHNCSQISFTHRSKFKQYVPEHLVVSDADRDEMKAGNPKKTMTKVHSSLLERRYIHVHLFEYSSEWHCFYFSYKDIEPANTNHWKYGSHLHYISYLWPGLKKRWIWSKFNKRFTDISGSLHIRFEPFEFPNHLRESSPKSGGKLPPWAVIFDPNTVYGCGSIPLPAAHVATRGLWFAQVSLRPH